ncbi:MAG: malto-oligosyltrehalose synthase [Acidobacteriota bacterium]
MKDRRKRERFLSPKIPNATYRLQLSGSFRFRDAEQTVSYLRDLGVTDIYASPYFKASRGSVHGYDIVDHNTLNAEIGTEEEYDALIAELRRCGMGQVLDIVPNHMCITSRDNAWWMDVLENGPSSVYSDFFDIDWDPVKKELKDKVLLPVLGEQYGSALENQELVLAFEEGAFFLHYYDYKFPIMPKTYTNVLSYRLDRIEKRLSSGDENVTELISIITALEHLPAYTERDPGKIRERYREKEVVKKRLWKLYQSSKEIRNFIERNVKTFNGAKGDSRSFDLLDRLLGMQVYRLSFWRVATDEINYRRFFDINDLAAIRVENPDVFRETHRMVLHLIRSGKVTGLRVDHPDGLYNPSEYFRQLQRSCFLMSRLGYREFLEKKGEVPPDPDRGETEQEILKQYDELSASDPQYKPFYVVGEKILIKGERMPEEWPIFSTTGYVFLNSVNGIFVEAKNARAFDEIYGRFTRTKMNLQDVMYEKKKLIMQVAMSSEVHTLGHYLNRLSEKDRHTRDFTLNSLTDAIIEVIAFFPVYRTYINSVSVKDRDRQYIEIAVSKAARRNPALSESIFNFLRDVLLLRFPSGFGEEDEREWLDFVMRFQQITGPVMAKGVEDTAFYIYNRLTSLNEVGGMPDRFGTPLETFHGQNIERSKFWPHALIATSTHDSKRSEDVRARINALSEVTVEWRRRLLSWSNMNKKKKVRVDGGKVPERNEEYLLYQTLLGAWPVEEGTEAEYDNFRQRIRDYMIKAVREAKINSSWINPNAMYEEALLIFVDAVTDAGPDNEFLDDFRPFQKMISSCGMSNSLSETLLKITSPGVPDFYQGTELWNFSLVDPDNRRPVDYGKRTRMLDRIKKREASIGPAGLARDLAVRKETGEIKLFLIYKALNYRRENREIFDAGEYLPLETEGRSAYHVCAFARRLQGRAAITVVPRFLAACKGEPAGPGGEAGFWDDSSVVIPYEDEGAQYRNIFTGEVVTVVRRAGAAVLQLVRLFENFPVALLERKV